MIKLIVSDIDGTLVDSQGQLLPATITGVQAAVARGHKWCWPQHVRLRGCLELRNN